MTGSLDDRAKALIGEAVTILSAAAEMDRLPARWQLSRSAESALRAANDGWGAGMTEEPPYFMGLRVEIVEQAADVVLVLDNGDRILRNGSPEPGSVTIEVGTLRRRGYDVGADQRQPTIRPSRSIH